jgi:hypothetical protein
MVKHPQSSDPMPIGGRHFGSVPAPLQERGGAIYRQSLH